MLTFLTPLFLAGLAAAAVPVLVHLSRSRRTRRMRFSTTRFFTDQFLRSCRMSRVKERLLLALRVGVLVFLALAMARPVFLPKGMAFLTGRRSVVFVVDDSASMGCVDNGETLLERACAAARRVLDTLGPGDRASVVLAARRAGGPTVLFPEPTPELGDVRGALAGIALSSSGTDLTAATAEAQRIAATGPGRSREVYVFSDLQESGWTAPPDVKATSDAGRTVTVFLVNVRPDRPRNAAVTALQVAAARPVAGIPFALRPHIFTQGGRTRPAELSLYVDGRRVAQRSLEKLEPGRWQVPLLHHTFAEGGWHAGYVEIEDDGLPGDDRRYFAFEVMANVQVLAVNGDSSAVPQRDELFFLDAALTADETAGRAIRLRTISPEQFAGVNPDPYALVILANVEALDGGVTEKLEKYVDGGGSLLVFLGDRVDPAAYNGRPASGLHGGLLPATLAGVTGDAAADRAVTAVAAVDTEHPALAVFHDPSFADLSTVTFRALYELRPRDGTVLMRGTDGRPLLLEKAFGKGRVMLFAGTCDRDWTNFPVRPAYLPWLHRITAYLVEKPMGRRPFRTTGQAVKWEDASLAGLEGVRIRKPDGTWARPEPGSEGGASVFGGTEAPGIYAVFQNVDEGEAAETEPDQLFAVNLEGEESDLTYLSDVLAGGDRAEDVSARTERLLRQRLSAGSRPVYVEDPGRVVEASSRVRRGVQLWDAILVGVFVLACLEPWLANRISLRHYIRAAGTGTAR